LLQPVVEILAVAVPHSFAQHRPDCTWITVVPVSGHPIGRDTGDHLGRLEERLRDALMTWCEDLIGGSKRHAFDERAEKVAQICMILSRNDA
jgi:hypothetical protein